MITEPSCARSHHENSILNAIKVQLEQDEDRPPDASDLIGFIDSITKGGSRAMVDLAEVAKKHYFHPSTKGSNSIKKVLPAVMRSSEFLKNTFGQPIYGGQGRVPSRNFQNMVWWQVDSSGDIFDPYKLLVASLEMVQTSTTRTVKVSMRVALPAMPTFDCSLKTCKLQNAHHFRKHFSSIASSIPWLW